MSLRNVFDDLRREEIKRYKHWYKFINKGKYTTCKNAWCGKKTEKYRHHCKEHRSDCVDCGEETTMIINGENRCMSPYCYKHR